MTTESQGISIENSVTSTNETAEAGGRVFSSEVGSQKTVSMVDGTLTKWIQQLLLNETVEG